MIVAPFFVALVGICIEATVIRRLYATPVIAMLATYAIGLIIREIVRGLIGGQYFAVDEPIAGAFEIGAVSFSIWRTVIIVLTAALMLACFLFLTRTSFGLQIRGALENPALAWLGPCVGRLHHQAVRLHRRPAGPAEHHLARPLDLRPVAGRRQ